MVATSLWVIQDSGTGKLDSLQSGSKKFLENIANAMNENYNTDVFRVVRVSDGAQLLTEGDK